MRTCCAAEANAHLLRSRNGKGRTSAHLLRTNAYAYMGRTGFRFYIRFSAAHKCVLMAISAHLWGLAEAGIRTHGLGDSRGIYRRAKRHAFFLAALVEVHVGTSAHLLPCKGLSALSSISPEHISAHLWPINDLCGSKGIINGHLEVGCAWCSCWHLHTSAHLRPLKYSQFGFQDVNKCALMRTYCPSKRLRSTLQVRTCGCHKCALRCYKCALRCYIR